MIMRLRLLTPYRKVARQWLHRRSANLFPLDRIEGSVVSPVGDEGLIRRPCCGQVFVKATSGLTKTQFSPSLIGEGILEISASVTAS